MAQVYTDIKGFSVPCLDGLSPVQKKDLVFDTIHDLIKFFTEILDEGGFEKLTEPDFIIVDKKTYSDYNVEVTVKVRSNSPVNEVLNVNP
jgi:hypothetical protein